MNPHTDTTHAPALPLVVKSTAQGIIEGLAATYGGEPDAYGDVIDPGAFASALSRFKGTGAAPVMLWAHDPSRVIGRWIDLRDTPAGLSITGQLNLKTEAGRDAYEHIAAGDLSGLSIGYRATKTRRDANGARALVEVDLAEVSLVAMPAMSGARVASVKSAGPITLQSKAELVALLRDAGLPQAAAKKIAGGGWPALESNDDEMKAAELVQEIRAIAATWAKGA